MKLLLVLLFLSIASVLADQPIALRSRRAEYNGPYSIDGLVYSRTYGFDNLSTGLSNYSGENRWVCDDFELDDDYYVTEILVWMIWTGDQTSIMNFVISEDDACDSDPNTNTHIWEESLPCTNTFTGDNNWGYEIYEVYCTISADAYPELDAGAHYYFETQADVSDNSFILCPVHKIGDCCWHDSGSGEYVRCEWFGLLPDLFFDFYGEPVNALEPETWGSIKTLF